MAKKPVLVTGGAGFIGSHTCKALSQAGFLPITYDSLVYGHKSAVRWGPLEVGDILDEAQLDLVFKRYSPVAVIHFAAFAYVGESVTDPAKYYRNNVAGSLALLDAARRHGASIVFSSSCATYGVPERLPISEDLQQSPINPYGATKLIVEWMLRDYWQAFRLPSIALRYFNAAGADPDGEIGEDHDPETHLIPLVLDAALGGPQVRVFGTDYDTPDGTCVRDYVHVSDLARAHVLALQRLLERPQHACINLGIEKGFSVREVLASAERVTGRSIPHQECPRRPGDPAILISDAGKARDELGWTPTFSSLDDIVATAWAWRSRARTGGL